MLKYPPLTDSGIYLFTNGIRHNAILRHHTNTASWFLSLL